MDNKNDQRYIKDGMTVVGRFVKRTLDCVGALACIVVFSPLFLWCYCRIRREGNGPVIFSQERIGHHGKPFRIYKFRTMYVDAESEGPMLAQVDDDDPRLTETGRFLRAHHLDELPQLWNVFVGDMAFIGPRPERKFFIDQIMQHDDRYECLYQIRPGVTSYATLYNGYTDTMERMLKRLSLDLFYLEHRSWLLDFKILWVTFFNIVSGKKF